MMPLDWTDLHTALLAAIVAGVILSPVWIIGWILVQWWKGEDGDE